MCEDEYGEVEEVSERLFTTREHRAHRAWNGTRIDAVRADVHGLRDFIG